MAEKEEVVTREEIIGLVQLVIIFTAILAGREIGNLYGSYNEVSRLSVNLNFSEEQMAAYLRGAMQGENTTLNVGLAITIPGYVGQEGQVTQTPEYVRKWLISITLSPIVVTQPEVSDVELSFLVEGQQVLGRTYQFPREKVGYISFLKRSVDLRVEDEAVFRQLVTAAAAEHAGEVEITITGRAKANVLFLEAQLPFTTTRYPLVLAPSLTLSSTGWDVSALGGVNSTRIGDTTPVQIKVKDLTRVHSLTQNVTCTIYREGAAQPVFTQLKTVTAAPGTESTYVFIFTPTTPGVYYYSLESTGFSLAASKSPRIEVHPGP